MKVLDFFGFDHLPAAAVGNMTNLATIVGTRLRCRSAWVSGGNSITYQKVADPADGQPWFRTLAGTATYPYPFHAIALIEFDEIKPGLKDETSKLTMGVRQSVQTTTNQAYSSGTLVAVHEDDSISLLSNLNDWDSLAANTIHYWETVLDRVNNTVKLYRDNGLLKTVDLAARVTAAGKVKGLGFGIFATTTAGYGTGSLVVHHRDAYLAQVEDGDVTDRLGAQVVKRLPVAAVNAAWMANVAGQSQLDALNLPAAGLATIPTAANITSLGVTESDPNGLISFSTDGLSATDRITAINMQLDAVGTAGADGLDTTVLNGAAVESTKKFTFTQSFVIATAPSLSNYGKAVFLRQWNGAPGTKGDLANYKLKLKASS